MSALVKDFKMWLIDDQVFCFLILRRCVVCRCLLFLLPGVLNGEESDYVVVSQAASAALDALEHVTCVWALMRQPDAVPMYASTMHLSHQSLMVSMPRLCVTLLSQKTITELYFPWRYHSRKLRPLMPLRLSVKLVTCDRADCETSTCRPSSKKKVAKLVHIRHPEVAAAEKKSRPRG